MATIVAGLFGASADLFLFGKKNSVVVFAPGRPTRYITNAEVCGVIGMIIFGFLYIVSIGLWKALVG